MFPTSPISSCLNEAGETLSVPEASLLLKLWIFLRTYVSQGEPVEVGCAMHLNSYGTRPQ